MAGVGYARRERGILHRLDTDTSGVLVAARSTAAFEALRASQRAGLWTKEYLAYCEASRAPPTASRPRWHRTRRSASHARGGGPRRRKRSGLAPRGGAARDRAGLCSSARRAAHGRRGACADQRRAGDGREGHASSDPRAPRLLRAPLRVTRCTAAPRWPTTRAPPRTGSTRPPFRSRTRCLWASESAYRQARPARCAPSSSALASPSRSALPRARKVR
ncbi:MAG: hypothetical protein IPH72_09825 [Sandaracinaceae bacterium]|nr:hypothetical protein [Sandaracinaceae bacterium]